MCRKEEEKSTHCLSNRKDPNCLGKELCRKNFEGGNHKTGQDYETMINIHQHFRTAWNIFQTEDKQKENHFRSWVADVELGGDFQEGFLSSSLVFFHFDFFSKWESSSSGYQIVWFQAWFCCGVKRRCWGRVPVCQQHRQPRAGTGQARASNRSWNRSRSRVPVGFRYQVTSQNNTGQYFKWRNSGFGAAASLECEILCEIVGIPPAFLICMADEQ